MRRYPRLYGFGIFCLLLGTFVLAFSARAQDTSSITGKVTGDGGAPVENVQVVVYQSFDFTGMIFWNPIAQGTTNASGDYQVSALEGGTYRVGFRPPTNPRVYFEQYYNGATNIVSATDVIVPVATVVPNINVQLSSGAHIKGKVTGPANEGLPGIKITIGNGGFYTEGYTNNNGVYNIGGLDSGTYLVTFRDDRENPQYAIERYDNAADGDEPTPVTVAANQILANINAKLERLAVITGKVTDSNGDPVPDLKVVALASPTAPNLPWDESRYTHTDATGIYTLTSLYADVYRIAFEDEQFKRYSTEYYNNVSDPATATPLTVAFNSTTPNINAQLATRGAITGVLTNSRGESVADIEVAAEKYEQLFTGNYTWQRITVTHSDAAGHYTLCCLSEGSYRISFVDMNSRYTAEYYQDVLYTLAGGPETVTMVQVTATMTTTNINAQLNRYSVLAGKITDQHGLPAPQTQVAIYNRSEPGGFWQQVKTAVADDSGKYYLEAYPGIYRAVYFDPNSPARYLAQYYSNASDIDSATDINLTNEATTTIDIELIAMGRITGTVTDEQGNPIEGVSVNIYPAPSVPGDPWISAFYRQTDSNGHYSLNGLEGGTYRIGFVSPLYPNLYAEEFYNEKLSVEAADDIVVATGMTAANINAQLALLSQIKGRITDEEGNPISFVYPTIYRYVAQENGTFSWEYIAEIDADYYGNYQSQGLEPGQYRIMFQKYGGDYQSEWYDNVGYDVSATTINLAPSTVLTINAQLASEPFTWPPLAQNDALTVTEGGMATQLDQAQNSVLYNDLADSNNALQAAVVTLPQHGTLTLNSDGTFTYLHDGSEASSDHFTYRVNDGVKQSNLATVTITILPINDLPVANDDAALVVRGGTVAALTGGATSLLANDSDPDDATLTAAVLANPQHGTLTLNSNGTFTYHHNGDSATSDSFTYRALDGFGAADSATVTITIADEAPLTFNKTVSIEGIKPRCTTVAELKVPVGTTIVYCYTVRNNNTQAVTSHSLVDSHLGQLLTNAAFNLAPGATYSTTFTQTLSVTTTNVATWTAIAAPAETSLLSPLAVTAQKAATVRIAGPKDDSDNDTIPDNLERAGDIDGDNIPNFLDTDADGDGVGDQAEVGASPLQPQDSNNNGIPDYLDATIQTGGTDRLYLPLIYR